MIELHDTHGMPQCGVEVLKFDLYYDFADYVYSNPDVEERIRDGYATVKEVEDGQS